MYPKCGSAHEIETAHDEIKIMLTDLRSGQDKIFEVAMQIASVTSTVKTLESDMIEVKKKLDEKISKKDAIVMGSIILGALTILQFIFWLHEHLK